MFKKHKEEKAEKKNKDVTEFVAVQETSLAQLDEQLAAAEATTDAAEKIVKLQGVIKYAGQLDAWASGERTNIAAQRAARKTGKLAGTGAAIGVAAVVTPLVVFAGPVAIPALAFGSIYAAMGGTALGVLPAAFAQKRIGRTKSKQLTEQNPAIADYAATLTARKARAQELLDETVKSFSFEEVSLSQHLKEALDEYSPFREAFAKAATETARQVLEEKAAAQQEVATGPVKRRGEPRPSTRLKITR